MENGRLEFMPCGSDVQREQYAKLPERADGHADAHVHLRKMERLARGMYEREKIFHDHEFF